MSAKVLADISVEMWTRFRRAGFKTSVRCSKDSLSRYVTAENAFCIRLSDHAARHDARSFDYEIIVRRQDDTAKKMREALTLIERLIGERTSAVA